MWKEKGRLFQIPSFCLPGQVLQAGLGQRGSRKDHSGVTAREDRSHWMSTGASTEHFSACCDPKRGGGEGDTGGLCLAERRKKIVAFVERICKVKET